MKLKFLEIIHEIIRSLAREENRRKCLKLRDTSRDCSSAFQINQRNSFPIQVLVVQERRNDRKPSGGEGRP